MKRFLFMAYLSLAWFSFVQAARFVVKAVRCGIASPVRKPTDADRAALVQFLRAEARHDQAEAFWQREIDNLETTPQA